MHTIRVAVLSDDRLFAEGLERILAADVAFLVLTPDQGCNLDSLRALDLHIAVVDSRMQGALDLCPGLGSDGMAVVFVATPNGSRNQQDDGRAP